MDLFFKDRGIYIQLHKSYLQMKKNHDSKYVIADKQANISFSLYM